MRLDPPPRLLMAPPLRGRRGSDGFTLIELMITVAIVGILAAVAYPSYKTSVLKGRRAEARTALIDLVQQQERYMTQNGSYMQFGATTTNVPFKKFSGDNANASNYNMTADVCSTSLGLKECVKVTATPTRGEDSDPDIKSLSLTSTGLKSCNGAKPAACW